MNYKNEIRKCNILGVNVSCLNMKTLLEYIKGNLDKIKGKYICVTNVHTLVTSYDDEKYRNVQNGAILVLPDGGPVAKECRKRGYTETERTTGPDFLNEVLKVSGRHHYKHFFYGSTEETLTKLKKSIDDKYNNVDIVGMYSPPFRKLTKEEDESIIKMINESKADFLWVGLGAPKQEIFMAEHKDKINSLMVGVGAAFDYVAGNIKRAPKWMQKMNLEWLYRLMQDPIRLFNRYLYTNTKFIVLANILKK